MSKSWEKGRIRIRERLEQLGWSQAELARQMKVPPTVINRWLNGEHIPSLPALFKLIEALGMGIEDVLKDDVPPPAPSVDPSLLILLSRASPAQIRALKHLLEQMVLEETNHHLTKEVSRKKLLTKKR